MGVEPGYSVASSSTLSDDFIMTADVLVNLETASSVGVFSVANVPQALFVRADGVLCQIMTSTGVSAAGWSVSPVGTTAGVTQVVAGVQNDGSVHGFYTDGAQTWHVALVNGAWGAPSALPKVTGLALTTNSDTGELVPYGIDASGHLSLMLQGADGNWSASSLAAAQSLAGLKPVLVLTDAANDWVLAVPGSASTGGYLDLYQGSTSAVLSGPEHVAVANPVDAAVLGYYTGSSAMFLFTDVDNGLYMSVGTTADVQAIPNAAAAHAAGLVDYDGMLHVYTVDAGGTLAVLHQTGSDTGGAPIWAPVIPLATGLQAVFADSNPMDTAALFALDDEAVLWHYVQDPVTSLWAAGKAQTPGEQSYRVAQFRTEITVADANGSPAGNLPLSITASTGSAVMQGGVLYPIGPATPVTVTTNPLGKVTLSTLASGLSAPALTVAAAGTTLASGINPAHDVHAYLSGTSTTLNAGTSAALPAFSGNTVQNTTVGGQPLAPATQGENGSDLASKACSGIQQTFAMPVSGNTAAPPPDARARPVAFAVDLSDRANPRVHALHTNEEYQAYRAGFFAPEAGGVGSWWSDVSDFFTDVWNGIKTAAIAVTKFVVHVADQVIDLVAQVAGEIVNIVGAAVSGIEELISAVQGIFAWIGAEIDKLIDWLKMLFDWSAIADTSSALQSALSQAFPYLQGLVTDWAGTLVDGFFTKLETSVSTAFDTMIDYYQGQALGSLVPAGSSRYAPATGTRRAALSATASPLALASGTGSAGAISLDDFHGWQGGSQNNWLLEKIESFLGLEPTLPTVDGLADKFATLKTKFDTVADDFEAACNDFAAWFKTAVQDPAQLGTVGIADLLNAAKNVALAVLTFLDAIIDALLDVVGAALGAAGELLTAPLDIPFFTFLWNEIDSLFGITMPSISVAGVFCTAFAIPVTLLFKLANGVDAEPFPGGTLPTGNAARPVDMPAASGGGAALATTAPGDEDAAKIAIQYTAAGVAALWALMDTGLDCVPKVELMVFKLLDLLAPTLLGIFTWPGGIPFTAVPLDSSADKAAFANWVIGWSPVALGLATMVAGGISWAPTSTVPRYIDPAGKILLTAAGAISLIAGIVASALGGSGGAIAANIVGPLPVLGQFLRLESLEEGSEGLTLAIKLVIDFFAGEGLAVAIAAA